MRKKIFIALAILVGTLFIVNSSWAQQRKVLNLPTYDQNPYHFGFILAGNQMLFSIKTVDNMSSINFNAAQTPDFPADSSFVYELTGIGRPGFTIGILGNLRLGNNTDLRFIPALSFGERALNYNILTYRNGESKFVEIQKNITSTLLLFPLEFKYRSHRLNNMAAYVLGGATYTIDLASQKKAQANTNDITVKIQRNDVLLEVGTGFDFYTNYFKFGVQAKMGYGLNNLIKKEGNIYTDVIDQLNSKFFLLSFTFE